MEFKVRASDYKKRTTTPSSSLINDAFRTNPSSSVLRPSSRVTSSESPLLLPRGKSSLTPLPEKQHTPITSTTGMGITSPVYLHSMRRSFQSHRGQKLHSNLLPDDESAMQAKAPSEVDLLDDIAQSSLMCCEGAVALPNSEKGIWSSPYALVPSVQSKLGGGGSTSQFMMTEYDPLATSVGTSTNRKTLMLQGPPPPPHANDGRALIVTTASTYHHHQQQRPSTSSSASLPDPFMVYRHVEQRLQRELVFLSCSNAARGTQASIEGNEPQEKFRVFKECAQHLGLQIGDHAPIVRRLFDEYNSYVGYLENRCLQVNAAERERDESVRRMEEIRQGCDLQIRRNAEEYTSRLDAIQSTLRTHKNIEGMVGTIKNLEITIVSEREKCRALEHKIQTISFLREEFEKSLHHVEESFLLMSNEREMELTDYRRDRLKAYEDLMETKDECRQTVADMQMRLDAQQIVLETQMQREQMNSDQIRDLQLYSLTMLQQVESLKKQLSELNARATSSEMSPRSNADSVTPTHTGDEEAGEVELHPTLGEMESPRNDPLSRGGLVGKRGSMRRQSPRGSSGAPMSAAITAASVAADLGLSQLSTPRPNKAEIIARMPDLGDPSKYPSTSAIIKAMLNQFDFTAKRLADATHTLNKLEERIEIVVLARAELLSREKLQRLMEERGFGEMEESMTMVTSGSSSPLTASPMAAQSRFK